MYHDIDYHSSGAHLAEDSLERTAVQKIRKVKGRRPSSAATSTSVLLQMPPNPPQDGKDKSSPPTG